MRASFSVLDQAWIPVVGMDEREELLGIRETLARAHELQRISSSSPVEEYSLYRFLGLVLMDALRPMSEMDIEDLLETGSFNMSVLDSYFETCRSEGVSFDLFDEARPFLQSRLDPSIDGKPKPAATLDCTRATGNNHTHFDHVPDEAVTLPPAQAARLLLVSYLFCTAGAQGYPSGVYGAPPYFGIIQADNLFESLVGTLLPLDAIGIPFDSKPVLWRRADPVIPKKDVGTVSWLEGMLFPTRRIHLVADEKGNVSSVYLCQGENFVNKTSWRDPYVTYRIGKDGPYPMRPNADRAIWRNLSDIINIPGGQASQLLSLYHAIHSQDAVDLTLYGVETSNASYLGIYRHTLSIPLSLSNESKTVDMLCFGITAAETLANALRNALLGVESLPASLTALSVSRYYQLCEKRFWQLCATMADSENGKETLADYCRDLSEYVLKAFSSAVESLSLRTIALVAVEQKRKELYKSIQKMNKEVSL